MMKSRDAVSEICANSIARLVMSYNALLLNFRVRFGAKVNVQYSSIMQKGFGEMKQNLKHDLAFAAK